MVAKKHTIIGKEQCENQNVKNDHEDSLQKWKTTKDVEER